MEGVRVFDCHCHILHTIDDGAKSQSVSLEMARIALDTGTQTVCATPHVLGGNWTPSWSDIVSKCDQLNQELQTKGLELSLVPGSEFFMDLALLPLVTEPGPYCLNGGRYLLVELPSLDVPSFAEDFWFTLQTRGITPILAHPERYSSFQKDPHRLDEWTKNGILLQVNAPSFCGRNGKRAQELAERLLLAGQVQLIGSDAHSAGHRNPDLHVAVDRIRTLAGKETVERLFWENPAGVLDNKELAPMPVVVRESPKKSWWQSLLKLDSR